MGNVDVPHMILWQDEVKLAEARCQITLHQEIEAYLAALLQRFSQRPDLTHTVVATAFLQALHEQNVARRFALAEVGDQCLLLSGLFPGMAEKRNVNIRYFVELGRSAYAHISTTTSDLYGLLARQFVMLMDILQSLNQRHVLLPLEAYELWHDLGSERAYKVLRAYGLRA